MLPALGQTWRATAARQQQGHPVQERLQGLLEILGRHVHRQVRLEAAQERVVAEIVDRLDVRLLDRPGLHPVGRHLQQKVAELAKTAVDFPPMQDPASFNLEAVKQQIEAAVKNKPGQ